MENSILKILNSEKARQLVNALILKNQEKAKYTEFLNKLDSIEHEKDRGIKNLK